jgi:hypothetical protein
MFFGLQNHLLKSNLIVTSVEMSCLCGMMCWHFASDRRVGPRGQAYGCGLFRYLLEYAHVIFPTFQGLDRFQPFLKGVALQEAPP